MIFVWGHKGQIKHLGVVAPARCPTCETVRPFEHVMVGKKATIYWIPTWSYDTHHFLACMVCQRGLELTKEQVKIVETMKPITAAWNVDALPEDHYLAEVNKFWDSIAPPEQPELPPRPDRPAALELPAETT